MNSRDSVTAGLSLVYCMMFLHYLMDGKTCGCVTQRLIICWR